MAAVSDVQATGAALAAEFDLESLRVGGAARVAEAR